MPPYDSNPYAARGHFPTSCAHPGVCSAAEGALRATRRRRRPRPLRRPPSTAAAAGDRGRCPQGTGPLPRVQSPVGAREKDARWGSRRPPPHRNDSVGGLHQTGPQQQQQQHPCREGRCAHSAMPPRHTLSPTLMLLVSSAPPPSWRRRCCRSSPCGHRPQQVCVNVGQAPARAWPQRKRVHQQQRRWLQR